MRHRAGAVLLDEGLGLVEGVVDRVATWAPWPGRSRACGQRQFALGRAQALVDLGGI